MPSRHHGCFVDYQNNLWFTTGSQDGVIQKYSHDGSKLLLQIGTKGRLDTSDGTPSGTPMNSSHTLLNAPPDVAVDPANGDVYVADGYGNRRIVVFDREGRYLRQWGREGTQAEVDAGVGGVFRSVGYTFSEPFDAYIVRAEFNGPKLFCARKQQNTPSG
jgi:DNA-binding beta-propeller fold protein YncE